jgi:FkbM family methyltransferase
VSVVRLVANLLPHFLVQSRRTFRSTRLLGYPVGTAAHAAFSRSYRRAMDDSRVAYFPESLRFRLDTVIDVGANEGQWIGALLAVASVNHIEAFEPNLHAVGRLREILRDRETYHIHQAAVGERCGETSMRLTDDSKFSSLLKPRGSLTRHYSPAAATVKEIVTVPVVTLDKALGSLDSIDLLKIDVQGFEPQVLAGARQVTRRTKAILIEANFVSHYEGDHCFADLHKLLTEDFAFELWNLSPSYYGAEGRAMWCDAVYVNRDVFGN